MTIIILCVVLGGLARSLVGSGHLSRWATYPIVAALCGYVGLSPTLYLTPIENICLLLWVVAVSSLNLASGWTKIYADTVPLRTPLQYLIGGPRLVHPENVLGWDLGSGRWMAVRLGLPSLVLVGPLIWIGSYGALLYPMIVAVAGLIYPHRQKLFGRLTWSIGSFVCDSARYQEFIVGAAVLGGLAFLN